MEILAKFVSFIIIESIIIIIFGLLGYGIGSLCGYSWEMCGTGMFFSGLFTFGIVLEDIFED